MRRRKRRGVSLGTIVMLFLTAAVLAGFCALLPTFTGNDDIRIDASELAVAIDQSFAQLAASASSVIHSPTNAPLPQATLAPAVLPTSVPVTVPPKLSFSLCAAGSIVLNNRVQRELTDDTGYCFDLLTDQLGDALQADLSLATLENTLISTEKLNNTNMPAELAGSLSRSGINALCVGFPDALNHGVDGLQATMQSIRAAGMTPYGLYASQEERSRTVITTVNGVDVALLSYQDSISSAGAKQLSEEERSFAYSPIDLSIISADIRSARQTGADVVIVSLCWGKIGAANPTDEQRMLAQSMADAGADIILGTHSGVLQPVQVLSGDRGDGKYHPVLCAYSLGNLFSHDREQRSTLASILLKMNVVFDPATGSVAFDDLTYTPTYAWRGKEDGVTRQRILISDPDHAPSFVDKSQKGVMERCLTLVTDVMADTGIPEDR